MKAKQPVRKRTKLLTTRPEPCKIMETRCQCQIPHGPMANSEVTSALAFYPIHDVIHHMGSPFRTTAFLVAKMGILIVLGGQGGVHVAMLIVQYGCAQMSCPLVACCGKLRLVTLIFQMCCFYIGLCLCVLFVFACFVCLVVSFFLFRSCLGVRFSSFAGMLPACFLLCFVGFCCAG